MSGEVRLLSDNDCLWIRADDVEDPSGTLSEYIALPAAEFDAWRRVVEAARARRAFERSEDGIESTRTTAEMLRFCDLVDAENAAVDALPPEAPQPRQPGREE